MASEARVEEQDAEKDVFRKYHSEFPWLKLIEHEGRHALGCRLCMSLTPARSAKDKFIHGTYVLGKYFYRRTLQNHENCAAHQKAKNSQPTETTTVGKDAMVSTPDRAVRRSGSSLGSSPITPSSSSKQGSPQPQSRKAYLLNQALTVYTALWHFWSMSTWQVAVHMARQVGGVLLESHDSETTFCRMRDGAFADMKRRLGKELRSCRAFSLCMDEKDIFLVVAVKIITEEWDVITRLLSYRELSGFTAPEIFGCLQQMLTELDIEDPCDATLGDRTPTDLLRKCLGFISDGASVMGSRRAFGLPGSNVAKLLQEACASRLLTTHCCAHRFQLSISESLKCDAYLVSLERICHKLFRFLRNHPHSHVDLVFWASLVEDEDFLSHLGTAKARWLSLLQPLAQIEKSYHTILCHLHFAHTEEKDREKRKSLAEIFQFMATWQFRVTLAGVADILQICFSCKNRLEKPLRMQETLQARDRLCAELDGFCRKNSAAADAFVRCGQPAAAAAPSAVLPSRLEKLLHTYTRAWKETYVLQYVSEQKGRQEYQIKLKPLVDDSQSAAEKRAAIKAIFQRLSDFATTCQERVFDRFPDIPVYRHFNIFESVEPLELRDVAPSFEALGTFYNLAENHLESFISGLRKLWAERSAEVAKGQVSDPTALWQAVLKQTADEDLGDSRRPVLAWLLFQSESASCERLFALAQTLRDKIGSGHSSLTYEPYLMVRVNGSQPDRADEVVEELATKVLADTDLRFAVAGSGWYKKNGRLIQRKRAQRSDFGSKRTKYQSKKRTKRLASQPVLRGLRAEGSSHVLAPSSEAPIPDIMQEHSPPKKRAAATTE